MSDWETPHIIGATLAALAYIAFFWWAIYELVKSSKKAQEEAAHAREEAIRAANMKVAKERRIRPRKLLKPSYPPSHNASTKELP